MAWNFFAIVDATDDDPRLYPILSGPDSTCAVQIDATEGRAPVRLWATAARVLGTNPAGQLTSILPLPVDVTWNVVVTDTRVIVYCEEYDKGGGSVGFGGAGLAVALAANAISKARAAHRRKGKVLVAHVRYPWLERVLATPKVSWLTSERIRLRVNATPGGTSSRHLMIEIELPKHENALSLANEIAHRAARYRLANNPMMQPDERQRFIDLTSADRRTPSTPSSSHQPTWATYIMPTSYRVNALTAFPKTPEPTASPTATPSGGPSDVDGARSLSTAEMAELERDINHAVDLLESGRIDNALAGASDVLERISAKAATGHPVDSFAGGAHQVLAVCYMNKGALDLAIEHYGMAEKLYAQHDDDRERLVELLHNFALLLSNNDAIEPAIDAMKRAQEAARTVEGVHFAVITEALSDLMQLHSSEPGHLTSDSRRTIAQLRKRTADATDSHDLAPDLANLAGLLLELGSDADLAEGQRLLLRALIWFRTHRNWELYVGALSMLLRLPLKRPTTVSEDLVGELTHALAVAEQLTNLAWQSDIYCTAAALIHTQERLGSRRAEALPLALRAIAYRDTVAAQTRSTLVRGLHNSSGGDFGRFIALTVASDTQDRELFVEILESGRLQVLPIERLADTWIDDGSLARKIARQGAVSLSKIYPIRVGRTSRLRAIFPPDALMPTDMSLFDTIATIGGATACWWWGATVIDGRYFWAIITPSLEMSVGYRDFDDATLDLLMNATQAVHPEGQIQLTSVDAFVAEDRDATPALHPEGHIRAALAGAFSTSPESEETMSLAIGDVLIPPPLREALWCPTSPPILSPSLVIASALLGLLPTCLLGARNQSGRIERLIEKATLRWAPTAPIAAAAAAHPTYSADEYPIGVACLDGDGTLPYAAVTAGNFEITLRNSATITATTGHGVLPALRSHLVNTLREIGAGAPKIFFFTGHSGSGDGVDAALVLEDGLLTAEDILFGYANDTPVPIPSRVLFSSCSSGGTVGGGRGEWLGLSAACLIRGAKHVVGTAWPILDLPITLKLEEELLSHLRAGADAASALRTCQLKRLAEWRASSHAFEDRTRDLPDNHEIPLVWAAFQCIGVC